MQFSRADWTLFRSLNTLPQKAGVPLRQLGALAVKELVDNALDAGAHVKLTEEDDWIIIEDDGPGIDHDQIATLFSINRPLTSSKIVRLPQRGALGNGLRVVMGVVYASGGQITVETGNHDDPMTGFRLEPQDSGLTHIAARVKSDYPKGTRIRLRLGEAVCQPGHSGLKSLALMSTEFSRFGTHFKGKTSPWWYDGEAFFEMCQAAGSMSLENLLKMFQGITPELAMIGQGIQCNTLSKAETTSCLNRLRECSPEPKPSVLGKIGDLGHFHRAVLTGTIDHGQAPAARLPYAIEAFAQPLEEVNPNADKDSKDLIRFMVNRTLIAGEMMVYRTKPTEVVLSGCGLRHRFPAPRNVPVSMIINITTPYMPITTDGKEPDLSRYLGPLHDAIKRSAGKCKRAVKKTAMGSDNSKKDVILRYLDEAIRKASSDGKYRFSLRQLYYAVRPYVLEGGFDKLDYNYFGSVITTVESEQGHDIKGMYRDPRGKIYHPHTKEEIPLGTINVEEYKRPAWTFNKILYIEKGGFFPLLIDVNWPERNDCALMTSQGFASRAARDVLDLLGDTQEDIYFFCIHDADAAGTMIYQSLLEATKARGKRRVHVVNLGLDPEEARDMGLQIEEYRDAGASTLPVASYLDNYDRKWLQTQRVELNAMTTEEFLEWLDSKFAEYAGKIVPPLPVMEETFREKGEASVAQHLTDKILREGNFDARATALKASVDPLAYDLERDVKEDLEITPEHRWDFRVMTRAEEQAQEIVEKE